MDGLRYATTENYNGLILRKTYRDLSLPGALMDRAKEWLKDNPYAKWNEKLKTWYFKDWNSSLTFGYLEHEDDKYHYQGSELDYVGFDELTQFTETQYLYLFSRIRKTTESGIPTRIRAATNPGGVGHNWVKRRFIRTKDPELRPFIPASYRENPYIDQDDYEANLNRLDYVTRMQLKYGDWDVGIEGGMFKKEWFTNNIVRRVPAKIKRKIRYWDFAETKPSKKGMDPDWTVGLLMAVDELDYVYVMDIVRFRGTPREVEDRFIQTTINDGIDVDIFIEETPAAGKLVVNAFQRLVPGYRVKGDPPRESKESRAKPVSAYTEQQKVRLLEAEWNDAFIEEVVGFPKSEGAHDDQVDCFSGAYNIHFGMARKKMKPFFYAV